MNLAHTTVAMHPGQVASPAQLLCTYLQAIEEVIREDRPEAPDAQHSQHMPPHGLLYHAAPQAPVGLLQAVPRRSIQGNVNGSWAADDRVYHPIIWK